MTRYTKRIPAGTTKRNAMKSAAVTLRKRRFARVASKLRTGVRT